MRIISPNTKSKFLNIHLSCINNIQQVIWDISIDSEYFLQDVSFICFNRFQCTCQHTDNWQQLMFRQSVDNHIPLHYFQYCFLYCFSLHSVDEIQNLSMSVLHKQCFVYVFTKGVRADIVSVQCGLLNVTLPPSRHITLPTSTKENTESDLWCACVQTMASKTKRIPAIL